MLLRVAFKGRYRDTFFCQLEEPQDTQIKYRLWVSTKGFRRSLALELVDWRRQTDPPYYEKTYFSLLNRNQKQKSWLLPFPAELG